MKKKGFTLIELLAVIVILAIIALIATPIILGVIEKAREGAAESSSLGYVDAIEKQVMINQVKNENMIADGVYDSPMTGISIKGNAPTSGWFKVEKGQVTDYSFVIGEYVVTKGAETIKGDTATAKPEGGSVAKVCTLKSGDPLAIGSKYECIVAEGVTKTFYVLEVTEDNVSLIMNQNIDNTTVAFCDQSGANPSNGQLCQADGAKAKLASTTSQWTNVDEVSLPTGGQIANVGGLTAWTSGNYDSKILPDWLYDYLHKRTNPVANVYGYWTSTPDSSDSSDAWNVNYYGYLNRYNVDNENTYGVRPVITITKSKI